MALIAHYRMGGDATDSIGDNDGSVNGGVTWVDGRLGQAAKFNGSSEYISQPSISDYLHNRPEASIAMWVKKDAIQYGFFQLSGYVSSNGNLYPYQTETKVYLDTFRTNRLGPIYMPTSVLEWHHFVVTQKPGEWKLYQNGELVHTAGANDYISTDYLQFEIGRNSGSRYANGQFDDVRVYDHALSEREVRDLSLGQVAHYKMDGDFIDYAGDHAVSSQNNVTWVSGKFGKAASFNGTDSYARINDPLGLNDSSRTFTLWMKKTSTGSNYNCALHRGTASSVGSSDIWIGYSGAGYLTATIGANSGVGWDGGETTVVEQMDEWYFMAVSWDGSTVRVYVNANLEKTYSLASLTDLNNEPLRFGASADGTNYQFGGLVDDARIYSEVLSDAEIKELYQQRASLDSGGSLHIPKLLESVNLVKNSTFEDDDVGNVPRDWVVATGSFNVVNDTSNSGNKSLYFPGDGVYNRARSAPIPVVPGERLYGRCATKSEPGGKFYFGLRFHGEDNSYIGYSYFSHPELAEWGETNPASLVMPPNAYYAHVWLFNYVNNTGACWVDDVVVSRQEIPDGFSTYTRDAIKGNVTNNGLELETVSEVGVTRGLVAWYPLIGDTKDYAGTNDATNNGAVATADGYSFDGVDDYVNIPDVIELSTYDEFTITTSVKYDAWDDSTSWINPLVSNGHNYWGSMPSGCTLGGGRHSDNTDSVRMGFHISLGNSTDGRFGTGFNSIWYPKTSFPRTMHIVGTYHKTATDHVLRVYIDGIMLGESATALVNWGGMTNNDSPMQVNRASNGANGADCTHRDVRTHNVALTPEEVAIQYQLALNKETKTMMTADCLYTTGQFKEVIS